MWPRLAAADPLHQTREEFERVDTRLQDWLARETFVSRRYELANEDSAEVMTAVHSPTLRLRQTGRRKRESAREDGLAGPPLATVRGVAATSAAQDTYNRSGRKEADN
jgi:hypothetical protein